MSVHVFVGPTLGGADVRNVLPEALLHAPVAHGDLLTLPTSQDMTVVIIDGLFHHVAPVRHKEILELLARGVRVVGCSSMGALRAAELHTAGMIGNGAVFEMYRAGLIDADDEVAVTHTEAPYYRRLSEPAVAFRYLARQATRAGLFDVATADRIISVVRALPYPARSWPAVGAAVHEHSPGLVHAWEHLIEFAHQNPGWADVKAADALDTLRRLGELTDGAPRTLPWMTTSAWRSLHLDDWCIRFSGHRIEGVHVGGRELLLYLQLYGVDFPRVWRTFTLSRIAGTEVADTDDRTLLGDAFAAARAWGLTPASVTPEQEMHWLTPDERTTLSADEVLEAILIRSYDDAWATSQLAAVPGILGDVMVGLAVVESHIVNNELASWNAAQSIAHLRHGELARRLAADWGLPDADERQLRAAAQDRGFGTFTEAAAATRPFFLRRHLFGQPGPRSRAAT